MKLMFVIADAARLEVIRGDLEIGAPGYTVMPVTPKRRPCAATRCRRRHDHAPIPRARRATGVIPSSAGIREER